MRYAWHLGSVFAAIAGLAAALTMPAGAAPKPAIPANRAGIVLIDGPIATVGNAIGGLIGGLVGQPAPRPAPAPYPPPRPRAPAPAAPGKAAIADIGGNWSTTDGRIIEIKQNGNRVSWTACCKPEHEDLVVSVSGTWDGKNLVGTYHYREGQTDGGGTVSYTLAGDRLEGVWKSPDGKAFNAALIRDQGEALGNLGGKWTTVAGRTVTLTQNGDQVSWTTCCRQSHPNWTADITGTFDGKNLTGTFNWRDGDKAGNGTVSYALKGNQLEGTLEFPGKQPYHSMLTRQAEGDLTGKWTSQTGSTVALTQNGNQVSGNYCCRPGHPDYGGDLSGAFDGRSYVGVFHYRDGGDEGNGTFSYTFAGDRLEGSIKITGGEDTKSVLTRQ